MAAQVSADDVRRQLPPGIGVGVHYVSDLQGRPAPPLFADEQEGLGPRAVPERRTLYALGRAAARDALAQLGVEPTGIPRDKDGAPHWPAGIVGAISHTRHVAMAIAGRREDFVGLGLDLEELDRGVREDIARLVCGPSEMDWVHAIPGVERLLMLFSAKESVFKALYPIERVWLGFHDAELAWQPERRAFLARVLKRFGTEYAEGFEMDVACTVGDDWVLTSAFLKV